MKINYDPRELETAIAYIDDYCRDQNIPCEKCVFCEWVSDFSLR